MKKIIFITTLVFIMAGCGAAGVEGPRTDEPVDKPLAELACSAGMSEYKVEGTTMEFCYDSAWGDVTVESRNATAGEGYVVSFAVGAEAPMMWYQTSDFALEDTDVHIVDFDKMVLYAPEDKIKEKLVDILALGESDFEIRKSDVGGKRAARVHMYKNHLGKDVDSIIYYVPEAFGKYHLTVAGDVKIATEVDDFVFDMVLN